MTMPRSYLRIMLVSLPLVAGQSAETVAQPLSRVPQEFPSPNPICQTLEAVAQKDALPLDFFVRVIWQESHFRADVVGPITRNGERAQGIAQFMPGTAAERGLLHPFDPSEALPQSGAFLAQLRDEFGNLGLAAAAYDAGPQRVRDFLAGIKSLPEETQHYVLAVTGKPVDAWKEQGNSPSKREVDDGHAVTDCDDLITRLQRTSARPASSAERNVPTWCRYLRNPNVSVCGSVHAPKSSLVRQLNQRVTKASLR
jgi:Transglycosylase SLT domain